MKTKITSLNSPFIKETVYEVKKATRTDKFETIFKNSFTLLFRSVCDYMFKIAYDKDEGPYGYRDDKIFSENLDGIQEEIATVLAKHMSSEDEIITSLVFLSDNIKVGYEDHYDSGAGGSVRTYRMVFDDVVKLLHKPNSLKNMIIQDKQSLQDRASVLYNIARRACSMIDLN